MKIVFDYSNLYAEMSRQKISQQELAEKSGVSKTTINQHMTKGTKFDCEQAVLIARALGLTDMDPYFFLYELQKT